MIELTMREHSSARAPRQAGTHTHTGWTTAHTQVHHTHTHTHAHTHACTHKQIHTDKHTQIHAQIRTDTQPLSACQSANLPACWLSTAPATAGMFGLRTQVAATYGHGGAGAIKLGASPRRAPPFATTYPPNVEIGGLNVTVPRHTTLRQVVPFDAVRDAERLDRKVAHAEVRGRIT